MAKRYSKYHSNFILKKRHQQSIKGTIWERDWVTIGDQHQIERGKRRYYFSGNFLFTDNRIPLHRKYHNFGQQIAQWYYDDVKNAKGIVNTVDVNWLSEDLRDYAYYGSCTELVRASIENIAYWLPGRIKRADNLLTHEFYENGERIRQTYGYELDNQYGIELYKTNIELNDEVNDLRYLTKSWRKFQVDGEDINSYKVNNLWGLVNCPSENIYNNVVIIIIDYGDNQTLYKKMYTSTITREQYHQLGDKEQKKYILLNADEYIQITETPTPMFDVTYCKFVTNEYYEELPINDRDEYVKYNDRYYVLLRTPSEYFNTLPEEGNKLIIKGYNINGSEVKYAVDDKDAFNEIHPKKIYVERFFESLDPFERALLNRETNPLYQSTFVVPGENERGYTYSKEKFVWPSSDGYPEINTSGYYSYVSQLVSVAQKMDDLWCDNLWRSMTHEAIKHYDWSYTREYNAEDEESFTIGGTRIENIIHIYGRAFDDIKRYIDGIKFTCNVTYDSKNNLADAELSDKLNYRGWDITSTIPVFNNEMLSEVVVSSDFLEEHVNKNNYSTDFDKWFSSTNNEQYTAAKMDIEFLRQLTLSSKYILNSKGTKDSLEMILSLFGFGINDFTIKEKTHFFYPVEHDYYGQDLINLIIPEVESGDKDTTMYYGLPLENVSAFNNVYFSPFYDKEKRYFNDLIYPQSKGGWLKSMETNNYVETLSYLYAVNRIEDLFSLNPYTLKKGDIYYVIHIDDYGVYDETIENESDDGTVSTAFSEVSHFFIIDDVYNPQLFESWHYVVLDENSVDFIQEEFDKAMYLANIISTNTGNNPHTGYGEYDDGHEYIMQMQDPLQALEDQELSDDNKYVLSLLRGLASDRTFTESDDVLTEEMTDDDINEEPINEDETEEDEGDFSYEKKIVFDIGEFTSETMSNKLKVRIPNYRYTIVNVNDGTTITHSEYKKLPSYEQTKYKIVRSKISTDSPTSNDLSDIILEHGDSALIKKITIEEYNKKLPSNYEKIYRVFEDYIEEVDEDLVIIDEDTYNGLTEEEKLMYENLYRYLLDENAEPITPYEYEEITKDCDFYKVYLYPLKEEYEIIDSLTYSRLRFDETINFYKPNTFYNIVTNDGIEYDLSYYNELSDTEKKDYAVLTYSFTFDDETEKAITAKTYDSLTSTEARSMFDTDKLTYADSRILFMNSKVLTIKNNIDNPLFKEYFNNVILQYITQVIPSTTILLLENFSV